ncbi:MAG: hypothetical protein Q9181_000762 [Wetmoreana brouardii]
MSSNKVPPTPSWRTHPLSQNILKPFLHLDSMASNVQSASNNGSMPLNAVYYPNWKIYAQAPPSSLDLEHITHLYYAFAFLKPDGTVYVCYQAFQITAIGLTYRKQLSDEHADTQVAVDGAQGGLNALRNLKQRHPKLKSLLSMGGGGKGSEPFASMASSAKARENFAASAKHMLDTYGFDGLDSMLMMLSSTVRSLMWTVDWEHPENAKQGSDYTSLLATLRKYLPAPKYLITSALPAGTWALQYINLSKASSYMDFVNLMAYDFAGPWTSMSGYQAQLHAPANSPADMKTSGQSAVQYMISKGVPAKKICLGIPIYGRSFLGVSHINQKFKASGGQDGTFEYEQLPRPGTREQIDHQAGAAFCVGGDGGLVTYDNPDTVRLKARFARQQGLAGLFYWTGPGDKKGPRSLVAAGHEALFGA